jgi:hypothetical protein
MNYKLLYRENDFVYLKKLKINDKHEKNYWDFISLI